jgi:hypothetical protein
MRTILLIPGRKSLLLFPAVPNDLDLMRGGQKAVWIRLGVPSRKRLTGAIGEAIEKEDECQTSKKMKR